MKKLLVIFFYLCFTQVNAQSIFVAGFDFLQKSSLGTSCSPTTIGFYDPNMTSGFNMTDIAFSPNGTLYGISYSGFYSIDTLTGQATLINTHTLINPNALVSDNNGTMYVADYDGGLYTIDITTGTHTQIATLPTGSAGDLAFYNGTLYMADVNNNLITINLNATPITTTTIGAMNIGVGQTVYGILTLGTNCQNAQFIGGSTSLYSISPTTAQTSFLCNVGTTIVGLSSLYDFLGSDCDLRVDLDTDNSSGATNIDYDIGLTCATNLTIADSDVTVYSSLTIDSIQIQLTSGLQNPNDEIFTYITSPNITMLQHSDLFITLVNTGGNASFVDFETAILNITYENNAIVPTSGLREISVIAYANTLVSDVAVTSFYLSTAASVINLGNDTILCNNNGLVLDVTTPGTSIVWEDNSTASIRTITQSGQYIATASNTCGTATDTINITIYTPAQTTIDTTICSTDFVTVANTPYNTTGTYTHILQTWQGCDSTITLNLIVNPTIQTVIDTTICTPNTITVANIVHDTNGTYIYPMQTWQGCDSTVTLNLTVNQSYEAFIVDTICEYDSYQLGGQSFNSTGNFSVTFPSILGCDSTIYLDLTVNPVDTTYKIVDVCDDSFVTSLTELYTSQFGCDSVVITNWVVNNSFLNLPDSVICSDAIYTIDLSAVSNDVVWQDGSTDLSYDISTTGTYSLTATGIDGCIDLDTFVISELSPVYPNQNLTLDTAKCIGDDLILNATTVGATLYKWEGEQAYYFQNDLNNSIFKITDLLDNMATISVEVTNRCGGFTYFFNIIEEDCGCEPFIPNVFTPNNDGKNDTYRVYTNCDLSDFTMTIFDRWGGLLYSTNNLNEGWDGMVNGEKLNAGVYVYMITFGAAGSNGKIEQKQRSGSFTLIR